MISLKQLFKTYNLKTWKQDKFQIFLSVIAISVAVAILVSLQLILSFNDAYTNINAKNVNEGDINIQLLNSTRGSANISDKTHAKTYNG